MVGIYSHSRARRAVSIPAFATLLFSTLWAQPPQQ